VSAPQNIGVINSSTANHGDDGDGGFYASVFAVVFKTNSWARTSVFSIWTTTCY